MGVGLDVVFLAAGGLILYFGAEWLVKGSAGLARAFGVRPIIIGLTVIAYGTSAPELAVSIAASIKGSSPMVIGNVVGSCVANLALILGLTALIAPPQVDGSLIRRELPVLLASAIAIPICLYDGELSRLEAGILIAFAIVFTVLTLTASSAGTGEGEEEEDDDDEEIGTVRLAGYTVVGLGALIGGGELFVDGARNVAEAFGLSEALIGATVVAFGTSVPELAASVVAAMRGYSGLAVGNVIGSNIFNIFLVGGAAGMVRPIQGTLAEWSLDMGFLVGVTLLGLLVMRTHKRVSRAEGVVLIATYVAFVILVAMRG